MRRDKMPNYNQSTRAVLRDVGFGMRVDREAADLPASTQTPYFHVYGGRCLVTMLVGEVTTVIQTQACNLSWESDPTTGTTNAMCAVLNISALEAGTLLSITGTVGDAMIAGSSGAVKGQLAPIVVAVGDLELKTSATNTGATKWSVFYVPLDDGAYIAAV
jgi:hypothetical protein